MAPSKAEIEVQLTKLLRAKAFCKSANQSTLLRHLVEHSLNQDQISSVDIAAALYPAANNRRPGDLPFTGLKAEAHIIRKKLAEYYENEGVEDHIIFTLPPAKQYKIHFSYNPAMNAAAEYSRGLRCLRNAFQLDWLRGIQSAAVHLRRAITAGFVPALPVMAELIIWDAFINGRSSVCGGAPCDFDFRLFYPSMAPDSPFVADSGIPRSIAIWESLGTAEWFALEAVRSNRSLWRSHLIIGIFAACRGLWGQAKKDFSRAIEIERRAEEHPFYIGYLIASNQLDEALSIAERRARADDLSAPLLYAACLYLARRYEEAHLVLMDFDGPPEIWFPTKTSWLHALLDALVTMARSPLESRYGSRDIQIARSLLGAWTGAAAFASIEVAALAASPIASDREKALSLHVIPDPFHLAIANAAGGKHDGEIVAGPATISRELTGSLRVTVTTIDWDVAKTAPWNHDRAVDCIEQAIGDVNPFVLLVRSAPLFDSLREHPGYQALEQRIYNS